MENKILTVKGKVQGVYFRASLKQFADDLGLKGFVKNQQDGSVTVEVEGDSKDIQTLEGWCKHGPALARVKEIKSEQGSVQNHSNFSIIR